MNKRTELTFDNCRGLFSSLSAVIEKNDLVFKKMKSANMSPWDSVELLRTSNRRLMISNSDSLC